MTSLAADRPPISGYMPARPDVGRCDSCRQPDRGLYHVTIDGRHFDVCVGCALAGEDSLAGH